MSAAEVASPVSAPRHGPLTRAQLDVLGQALADAVAHCTPGGYCADCEVHPAGLCEHHAGDLDRADAYVNLACELGIEAPR